MAIIIKNINLSHELSNFTSYSQFYEDLILFCIFYEVKNGFYIDVGANDPNIISVTKAFYLRGWYGINIEPLPNLLSNKLKNIRRKKRKCKSLCRWGWFNIIKRVFKEQF